MRVAGGLLALGPEQAAEPVVAGGDERRRALDPRRVHGVQDRAEPNPLLVLVARDGIGDARDVGLELVPVAEERAPLVVEPGRDGERRAAERVAAAVVGLDREAGLGRAERQLLPVPRHPRPEQRVLELVLPLRELARDDALLTGQAEPGDRLTVVAGRVRLCLLQRLQLLPGEEIRVARDDRRLLRRLLLPHADRPRLLRPVLEEGVEPLLERVDGVDLLRFAHPSTPLNRLTRLRA